MPITSSLDNAYVVLTNVTSFGSILASLAIISCYLLYKDIRSTGRKLLVCLSIANFFLGISGILQAATYFKSLTLFDEKNILCQAASFLFVYSSICSFLWTDIISFYLFLSVVMRDISVGNKLVIFFHVFCWVMPAIVALASGVSDIYGYDVSFVLKSKRPVYCWVSDRIENEVQWYYMTMEAWALASLIFCFISFIILTLSVYRQSKKHRSMNSSQTIEDMAIQTANKQLRYIPAIFVVLRLWSSLHFITGTTGPNKTHTYSTVWLLIMKGICDNSQGLANLILFLFTTKFITNKIKRWFKLHCNLCRIKQGQSFQGFLSSPKIFRIRGKYEKKRRTDEIDISGISLDLPTSSDQAMIEDEVVFERD
ncbi:G-protein coupled receptor 157 [Patella vulgata]|uniref:G-protein coupled receptor 157 n=1 Tax=Patella vulgata TaxID=6465 RepID=UPI0024A8257E|nr:G-protein coupled receptor 157 [Patella vulgata]